MSFSLPEWVDRRQYPFDGNSFDHGGFRQNYVDEGKGSPLVFVHGTPSWSFLWRHPIAQLRSDYRCIAPDHLGFGLSDKPNAADYTPAGHARRLEKLIDGLGLRDLTLIVHDFGGPIGLSYALEHPENVRRIVVMNTWMWSNQGNRQAELAGRIMGSPFGRFLYRRLNLSARLLLPSAFADRSKLSDQIHRQYLAPFGSPAEREAPWVLARELTGSNDWYESLWRRRGALAQKPMLLLWGMKDPLIPRQHLARWEAAFPDAQVVRLPEAGHFVQEEAPGDVTEALRSFLSGSATGLESTPGGTTANGGPLDG